MNTTDVLSGSAGLEGIQWMLTGAPRKALRRELAALLPSPRMLGPCRLRLARFKPGRKLRGFYDAHIREDENGASSVRPMVVTWKSNGDGARTPPSAEIAEMEAEALRRGLSTPFRKLAAHAPDLGMEIEVSPLDTKFPQLLRLCDPQYVREMITRTCPVSDGAPGHVRTGRYSVAFVRYRHGRRHVLRYDPLDDPECGAIFAKVYRAGDDGVRAFRLAKRIRQWLAEQNQGLASVQPLVYVDEDAIGLYSQVSGTPLSERLRRPGDDLADPLKSTGAALYALHELPHAVAGPLKRHDFTGDFEKSARTSELAGEHIPVLLPSLGLALQRLVGRVREVYPRLPLEPATFTYGDFKAEHVWTGPAGLTLIDFDSCRLGDPALDVGKFLADLRFWCITGGHHDVEQAQKLFLSGYRRRAPAERLLRARLYEVIELVKLSVRRVGMFEHDWAYRTERLISSAQSVLNGLQRRLGSFK